AGSGGEVLKAPVAEIAIEGVWRIKAAEVKITPTVAIDIAGSDAGAVEENLVRERSFLTQPIGEGDSGRRRSDFGETGFSVWGDYQRGSTMTFMLLPIQRRRRCPRHYKESSDAAQEMMTEGHAS